MRDGESTVNNYRRQHNSRQACITHSRMHGRRVVEAVACGADGGHGRRGNVSETGGWVQAAGETAASKRADKLAWRACLGLPQGHLCAGGSATSAVHCTRSRRGRAETRPLRGSVRGPDGRQASTDGVRGDGGARGVVGDEKRASGGERNSNKRRIVVVEEQGERAERNRRSVAYVQPAHALPSSRSNQTNPFLIQLEQPASRGVYPGPISYIPVPWLNLGV